MYHELLARGILKSSPVVIVVNVTEYADISSVESNVAVAPNQYIELTFTLDALKFPKPHDTRSANIIFFPRTLVCAVLL